MKLIILLLGAVVMVAADAPYYSPSYARVSFQRSRQAPYPTAGYPAGPAFTLPGEYGPASYGPPKEQTTTEKMVEPTEMVTESSTTQTPITTESASTTEAVRTEALTEGSGTTESVTVSGTTEYGITESESTTTEASVEGAKITEVPEYKEYTEYVDKDEQLRVESEESDEASYENFDIPVKNAKIMGDGQANGLYYIYHPSGLLQRVVYSTMKDPQNMGYTAQLSYQHVEEIKDPIFTYDPETYVFKQVYI